MIRLTILIILAYYISGCSMNTVKSHLGTAGGAVAGYTTCAGLLQANMPISAACSVVGAVWGAKFYYKNDMNTHTAIFVDTLNTAPGKRSHTSWGNSANGNWGSITINRTYVKNSARCREYTSVISVEHSWPMNGISRESETGTACQLPDGRWTIKESTNS